MEEFAALKLLFFAEVNSFKSKHLNSYANDVSISNSEYLIRQLQDNILRGQLKKRRNYQLAPAAVIKT